MTNLCPNCVSTVCKMSAFAELVHRTLQMTLLGSFIVHKCVNCCISQHVCRIHCIMYAFCLKGEVRLNLAVGIKLRQCHICRLQFDWARSRGRLQLFKQVDLDNDGFVHESSKFPKFTTIFWCCIWNHVNMLVLWTV